ncbi:MAG: carboxypeptidase regulatory-like domain-containing protein [Bacteroidota bacterium]|jgi:hypothetical protein
MKNRYWFFAATVLTIALIFTQSLLSQTALPPSSRNQIRFTSQPPQYGQKGVAYSYTAQAVDTADPTAVIHYYTGILNPIGLTIDSISGVVNWIPAAKGWYTITLIARSNKGDVAFQYFMVTVTSGNGIVDGYVKDTSGKGISNIIIEALQVLSTDPIPLSTLPISSIPISIGCYSYTAKTDSNGYYQILHIDPGTYKLHAVSPTPKYLSQWYDGQYNPKDANTIHISDTLITRVDFTLRGGVVRLPMITVSGLVTDTNLLPIKIANIFFVRSGFALNTKDIDDDYREYFEMNVLKDDFRLEGKSQNVYNAKVDSLGKYSLHIPQGSYIAFAKARGYATEFYLEQSDLLSANLLVLQQDSAGINFILAPLPKVVLGTITGSVLDSLKDVGVPSRIIAFRDRWISKDSFNSFRSYVVDTDTLGVFTVDSLLPGSYYVFAIPLGNYSPAFYSSDTANTMWKKATRVVINGNTVDGINIYVHQVPSSMNGYASISGAIRFSSGSVSMAGALVYAANRNAVVSGFAITDENGNYSIDGLAPGTYTVTVDKLGYNTETTSQSATVSYSTIGNPVNANVDLSIDAVTGVTQTSTLQPTKFMLEQNFPNPFNPSTTINYALNQSGIVTLKVYNLLGQEVRTLVNGFQNAGSYHTTFNAQGLSSGIYFYRLQSQNIIQTRKMILLQ